MQVTSREPTGPRRWKQVLEGHRYYMLCTIPKSPFLVTHRFLLVHSRGRRLFIECPAAHISFGHVQVYP